MTKLSATGEERRRLSTEGKRIECRFCSLQPILLASPLVGVDRRVRPGGKLGHGDCADDCLEHRVRRTEMRCITEDSRIIRG